jgi:plastocyanin
MERRELLTSAAVLATPVIAGCSSDGGGPGDDNSGDVETINIEDQSFNPVRLEVEVGTTVEWANQDGYRHTLVSGQFTDQGSEWSFDGGALSEASGNTATYTFDSAGAYEYYCPDHTKSVGCGVVIVGDATHDATLPCEEGDGVGVVPG